MNKPSETKPCPECDRYIPVSAVQCRCGWMAPAAAPHYVACSFAGCPERAVIRTRKGANVCVGHDVLLVQKSADAYCKALGLETADQKRAYVKQLVRGMKRKFTPPDMREPGEDREGAECPL